MTDTVVYSYKGYAYKTISLYEDSGKYHVMAGKDDHNTPFYFQKKGNNWKLMMDCPECEASLEFFTEIDTKEDRYNAALKAVTQGAYIYEGYSPSIGCRTGHYYASYN